MGAINKNMNEARFETPNIIDWKSFTDDEQIKAELKNLSRQKIAEIIARTNGPTIPDETAPKDLASHKRSQ